MLRSALMALFVFAIGCGTEAGSTDSGHDVLDSGAKLADIGQPDSGQADIGSPDAGDFDSGVPDAEPSDSGLPDVGVPDADISDSGPPDADMPDAGQPDADSDPCHGIHCNGPETCVLGVCVCPSGFYVDGTGNCVTDHCYGVTCDDGNPCNGTETCDKATGCKAGTPVVCPDDGNKCNGTEQCNPLNGQCIHVNPLTCDDGLRCNGAETCNPSTGCIAGTAETCSGHGSCQEAPSALCNCAGNWTGPNCATCPAGFTGSDCHVDLCYLNTCSGHGTCNPGDGSCGCSGNWNPATQCSTCNSGYGGANCDPVPTISGLAIDCSKDGGLCYGGSIEYPVTFSSTNATGYSVTVVMLSGIGDAGYSTPSSGTIVTQPTTFNFTTGDTTAQIDRITVTVTGPGGLASAYIDVLHY